MRCNRWILGTAAMALCLASPSAGRAVSFQGLGAAPDGQFFSEPTAISADGSTVVGRSGTGAFVWDAVHGMRGPGDLPGWTRSNATPMGVSGDGTVVVGNGGNFEGFVWDATDGMRGLGGLPGEPVYSEAHGVSADGRVVVGRTDSSAAAAAFRWDAANGLRTLGDLPGGADFAEAWGISADGSTVVGRSESDSGLKAFVWDERNGMQALGDLASTTFGSVATAVSANGSVVVGAAYPNGGYDEPFVWDPIHGIRRLDPPAGAPAIFGVPTGVSADGSIVVGRGSVDPGGPSRPFVWDAEHGVRFLDDLLTSLGVDLSDWQLGGAVGISADGRTILGVGSHFSTGQEAWIAVIPEPSVALLLGLGLAGVGALPRRR